MTTPHQAKTLDINAFTLGELEEFESATGLLISSLNWDALPLKAVSYLLYLDGRRDNPEFTLEDARAMKVVQLNAILGTVPASDEPAAPPDPSLALPGTPAAEASA